MPIYQVGALTVNLHSPRVDDVVRSTSCPECGFALLVQEQDSRYGHEFYLECRNEECGAAFYPQS